jgi:hypothetical protein
VSDFERDDEPPETSGGANGEVEIVDLQVRDHRDSVTAGPRQPELSLARSIGETTMSLTLRTIRGGFLAGRFVYLRLADTLPARLVSEAAGGAIDAFAKDGGVRWQRAGREVEEQLGRVIAVVVPVVVQAIDPDELMAAIDINAILTEVDIDAILDRVDIDALLEHVDVNALLDRVDVDGLMARVDVNALMDRVDVDAIMGRVDVDAIMDRVDVNDIAKRAQIGELVAESTSDVAGSVLDVGRRQAVGLDMVLARTVNRVLGRDPAAMPVGPEILVDDEEERQ